LNFLRMSVCLSGDDERVVFEFFFPNERVCVAVYLVAPS